MSLIATPVAVAAVTVGALSVWPEADTDAETAPTPDQRTPTQPDPTRADRPRASRSLSGERPGLLDSLVRRGGAVEELPDGATATATVTAVGTRYLTADLNVWTGPGERYRLTTVLPTGDAVKVTGVEHGPWAQVIHDGRLRWVRAAYLVKNEPDADVTASGGVTMDPCPLGTGVEAGLTSDAVLVYRSVCARYPQITSYGGVRPDDGEHGTGQALDIMVSDQALGDEIADWVRANASALGVSEVLWAQHIWTVERSSEGWRLFENRGSATANHFDHVHVTVYGSSAG